MITVSALGVVTSFAAGVISFLSPCVLPLVPGYISYVAGQSLESRPGNRANFAALRLSIFFVLGFSTVFVMLGASATALGQLFLAYRYEANLAAGAGVIVFGLLMIGVVRWPWLQRDYRIHLDTSPVVAQSPPTCLAWPLHLGGRRASARCWGPS
jgi:cytochrome c-type biogenesis protein